MIFPSLVHWNVFYKLANPCFNVWSSNEELTIVLHFFSTRRRGQRSSNCDATIVWYIFILPTGRSLVRLQTDHPSNICVQLLCQQFSQNPAASFEYVLRSLKEVDETGMSIFNPLCIPSCLWTFVGFVLTGDDNMTLATERKDANLINYTKNNHRNS
jgi:hypothetical protein